VWFERFRFGFRFVPPVFAKHINAETPCFSGESAVSFAGFKIRRRKAFGFESRLGHQLDFIALSGARPVAFLTS